METNSSPELMHFVRSARKAGTGEADDGEFACAALADQIIECVPWISDTAVEGLIQFIRLVKTAPMVGEGCVRDRPRPSVIVRERRSS